LEAPGVGHTGDDAHLTRLRDDRVEPSFATVDQDDQPGDVGATVARRAFDQGVVGVAHDLGEIGPGEDDDPVRPDGTERRAFGAVDHLAELWREARPTGLLNQHPVALGGGHARQQRRRFLRVQSRDIDLERVDEAAQRGRGEHQPPRTWMLWRMTAPPTDTVSAPCTIVVRPPMTTWSPR